MSSGEPFPQQVQSNLRLSDLTAIPSAEDLAFAVSLAMKNPQNIVEIPWKTPHNPQPFTLKVTCGLSLEEPRWILNLVADHGLQVVWNYDTSDHRLIHTLLERDCGLQAQAAPVSAPPTADEYSTEEAINSIARSLSNAASAELPAVSGSLFSFPGMIQDQATPWMPGPSPWSQHMAPQPAAPNMTPSPAVMQTSGQWGTLDATGSPTQTSSGSHAPFNTQTSPWSNQPAAPGQSQGQWSNQPPSEGSPWGTAEVAPAEGSAWGTAEVAPAEGSPWGTSEVVPAAAAPAWQPADAGSANWATPVMTQPAPADAPWGNQEVSVQPPQMPNAEPIATAAAQWSNDQTAAGPGPVNHWGTQEVSPSLVGASSWAAQETAPTSQQRWSASEASTNPEWGTQDVAPPSNWGAPPQPAPAAPFPEHTAPSPAVPVASAFSGGATPDLAVSTAFSAPNPPSTVPASPPPNDGQSRWETHAVTPQATPQWSPQSADGSQQWGSQDQSTGSPWAQMGTPAQPQWAGVPAAPAMAQPLTPPASIFQQGGEISAQPLPPPAPPETNGFASHPPQETSAQAIHSSMPPESPTADGTPELPLQFGWTSSNTAVQFEHVSRTDAAPPHPVPITSRMAALRPDAAPESTESEQIGAESSESSTEAVSAKPEGDHVPAFHEEALSQKSPAEQVVMSAPTAKSLPKSVEFDRSAVDAIWKQLSAADTGFLTKSALLFFLVNEAQRYQQAKHNFSVVRFEMGIKGEPGGSTSTLTKKAMREAAKRIFALMKPLSTVGHYGETDYTFILPHTNREQAIHFVTEVFERLTKTPLTSGVDSEKLALHFGLASMPEDCTHPGILLAAADKALLQAKESNRPILAFADTDD